MHNDNIYSDDFETQDEIFQLSESDIKNTRAILLGINTGKYDAERSVKELAALADANSINAVIDILQNRDKPDSATVIGKGRLEDAKTMVEDLDIDLAIFDGELTGSQIRNIEKKLDIPVIDRTMLILEIFANRATTHEGKLQTELATLEYRLPRLAGLGASLSRQGGGGGGGGGARGGGARRGGGEQKLEYDRRYVHNRIAIIKKKLSQTTKRREETRRTRKKSGVPVVALVGYTNVGKSSLLNALTGSEIGVADMLFATLDPSARKLELPDGQTAVLIDTVGFVSRLPHGLVEAFKSTLQETEYADLLLVVCDAADPEAPEQLRVTEEVMGEIGAASKPKIIVYNKSDIADSLPLSSPAGISVSATTGAGLAALKEAITHILQDRICQINVLLPYSELNLASVLHSNGKVDIEEYQENGVYYEGSVERSKLYLFKPYLVRKKAEES